MSAERKHRIETLAKWWKDTLTQFIRGRMSGPMDFLFSYEDVSEDALDMIAHEAQKRWLVSRSTSLDYGRIAFNTSASEFRDEVERQAASNRKGGSISPER